MHIHIIEAHGQQFTDKREDVIATYDHMEEKIPDEFLLKALEQIVSTEAKPEYSLFGGFKFEHGKLKRVKRYNCADFVDQVLAKARELMELDKTSNP